MFRKSKILPTLAQALPGRPHPIATATEHSVFHRPLTGPYPDGLDWAMFGMGCFWGAERLFWRLGEDSVWITAAGYAGGETPNPTYEEVCSGQTGHAEVVLIGYYPQRLSYARLLKLFWENHDPTQGMRQGADIGTQYRSAIYAFGAQALADARASQEQFGGLLTAQGLDSPTTEIREAPKFYFAEDYHQQYLAKNPSGYCGLGGLGIACPMPQNA